jgi:hypothetical protein
MTLQKFWFVDPSLCHFDPALCRIVQDLQILHAKQISRHATKRRIMILRYAAYRKITDQRYAA